MLQKTAINELTERKNYHIVFPTYRRLPILLDTSMKTEVSKSFEQIFNEYNIIAIAYKILTDHVHLLIEKQPGQLLPLLLNCIKGVSTYDFFNLHSELKMTIGRGKLWARGYHYTVISNQKHYINTIHYIENNFDKYLECIKTNE